MERLKFVDELEKLDDKTRPNRLTPKTELNQCELEIQNTMIVILPRL
jgi:hypothetical protein